MTIHILYANYFDRDGRELSVGGIQTYLTALSEILVKKGLKVNIFQSSNVSFKKKINGINVYGCKCALKKANKELVKACKEYLESDDIIIFGTDSLVAPVSVPCIAIQHGISWDVPYKNKSYFLCYLKKSYKAWLRINQIKTVDQLVCVDHNFINWMRAVSPYCKVKTVAIPNFTRIPVNGYQKKDSQTINIIFARRFFWYRGTKVFANAIEKIITERSNLIVTFAGEGEDEVYLEGRFSQYSNVRFIKYNSGDSLAIHSDKHIAVVPTVGSEGTSLSLLEAMASSCAVVCTDVGGITNIIIDGYNGLMVSAGDENQLYDAILTLIDNREIMNKIAINSYETVKDAFSFERWAEKWNKVIDEICM